MAVEVEAEKPQAIILGMNWTMRTVMAICTSPLTTPICHICLVLSSWAVVRWWLFSYATAFSCSTLNSSKVWVQSLSGAQPCSSGSLLIKKMHTSSMTSRHAPTV